MTARPLRLLAALTIIVGGACDGGSPPDETASTDPEADPTDEPVRIPGCDTTGTSTIPRRSPRLATQPALLNGVEVTEEGCLDVARFEFEEPGVGAGLPPGYVVEYRPGPFLVGEGEEAQEADIAGSAFLVVTLEATARGVSAETSGQMLTYTGPTDFVPGALAHLQEMMLVVDAPDRMEWVIGVDDERPFLVDAAAGPPRVTIKIA
jgi:hypothetical protein